MKKALDKIKSKKVVSADDDEEPPFKNPLKKNLIKKLDNYDEMAKRINSDAYDIRRAANDDMFIDEVLQQKIEKYRLQRE